MYCSHKRRSYNKSFSVLLHMLVGGDGDGHSLLVTVVIVRGSGDILSRVEAIHFLWRHRQNSEHQLFLSCSNQIHHLLMCRALHTHTIPTNRQRGKKRNSDRAGDVVLCAVNEGADLTCVLQCNISKTHFYNSGQIHRLAFGQFHHFEMYKLDLLLKPLTTPTYGNSTQGCNIQNVNVQNFNVMNKKRRGRFVRLNSRNLLDFVIVS